MTKVIREGLKKCNLPEDAILLVENTDRAVVNQMMKLNKYIDVLIPRGGAGLIANVVQNSTVPVIETGTGNCHIFVDETADLDMAVPIVVNAKTQRLGVCNACESLVVHEKIAEQAIPVIYKALCEKGVEVRGDGVCSRDCTGDCDGNRRRLGHRVSGCNHFREDCFFHRRGNCTY